MPRRFDLSKVKIQRGRYTIHPWVGFWRWGGIRIGDARLLRFGPVRIFVNGWYSR